MGDVQTGTAVMRRLQKINRLRDELHTEFNLLARAMENDGQADYEIKNVRELQTTLHRSCHADLIALESAWESYVSFRKSDR